MKNRIFAALILAALTVVLFPGCAGQNSPRWKASVTGSYRGVDYGASYDGKTISTEIKVGDSLFGWSK